MKGSCLCGAVTYEVDQIGDITLCHCTMCQKAHGAPFGSYCPVANEHFRFLTGEDKVTRYRSSADVTRTFCSSCGSNLQFIRDNREGFGLAVDSLNADPKTQPVVQIHTDAHAPWWQVAEHPPHGRQNKD